MIVDKCLTNEWMAEQRVRMSNASDLTIERSIRALILLECLAVSDLRFVFKGGSCMMLHLPELRCLSAENGFRRNRYALNDALDDSLNTAFLVSQLQLAGEERWDTEKRRILLDGIGAINLTLCREAYTVEHSRVSASRVALLAALLRAGRSGRLESYRYLPERAHELPGILGGKYAVLNSLREVATEAFHNWHQVQMLDL